MILFLWSFIPKDPWQITLSIFDANFFLCVKLILILVLNGDISTSCLWSLGRASASGMEIYSSADMSFLFLFFVGGENNWLRLACSHNFLAGWHQLCLRKYANFFCLRQTSFGRHLCDFYSSRVLESNSNQIIDHIHTWFYLSLCHQIRYRRCI